MKNSLLRIFYLYLKIKNKINILYNRILPLIIQPPIIYNTDQTLKKIIESKCSVSRYGDGEFFLMNGGGILFQPYSFELSSRLKEIIVSKKQDHIVCIPYAINKTEWCTEKSKEYWREYLDLNRSKIYRMLNFDKEYFNSQVTRLYIDHKDKSRSGQKFKKIREVWKDREVVIIEGDKSRLGLGNDLFDNVHSLNRIVCPAINAYGKYNEILQEVLKQNPNKLFLLALGPTATVLAYDLNECGYQAIDIGHIDIEYEWFLKNAEEKTPVNNKYVGEVVGGTNIVQDVMDEAYEKEIISLII